MKIINIKKRPWWQILGSAYYWKVTIMNDDGIEESYNCWAGIDDPTTDNLLGNLRRQIEEKGKIKVPLKEKEKELYSLISEELDE